LLSITLFIFYEQTYNVYTFFKNIAVIVFFKTADEQIGVKIGIGLLVVKNLIVDEIAVDFENGLLVLTLVGEIL
jgi:hypothetical protein